METSFLGPEEYDDRAHQLYEAGDYDEALELLREGLRVYPQAAALHVGLGYVRLAREEFAWARSAFAAAIEADAGCADAWVGLGETRFRFGERDEALACFRTVDALGVGDDVELGLTIGRALYREGCFQEARARLDALAAANPDDAEVTAARAYTAHALGDAITARRLLRRALRQDPEQHEARVYLAHLLHDAGDAAGALRQLEQVPPGEHWDTVSLWRFLELKCGLEGVEHDDPVLRPWRERLVELEAEPDDTEHVLAEVEARFQAGEGDEEVPAPSLEAVLRLLHHLPEQAMLHRVRVEDGSVLEGTWEEIVKLMRDRSSEPGATVAAFMRRAARQVRERTGDVLPCHSAEAFVRAGAVVGLLRIES